MPALQFDSTDVGRTEEFLSQVYAKMSIGVNTDRPRTQVRRQTLGTVDVDDLSFDFDLAFQAVEPIGKVCLLSMYGGTVTRQWHLDGTDGSFGPGDVFMYAPHDRPCSGVVHGARYDIVMFDPRLLADVAGVACGPGTGPVRLTGDRPVSSVADRQLQNTIVYLRAHMVADPACRESPLIVSTASQLLAASVLSAFPHNALIEATAAVSRDAQPATVRRAVAYIDAHAHEPISMAGIAAAAGTTGRAVQAAFRRHRGTTPMGYLRQVRLDGAHRDLRAADPTKGDSVAAIAARWGFGPSARFAGFYRKQYGTLPSQTLRR